MLQFLRIWPPHNSDRNKFKKKLVKVILWKKKLIKEKKSFESDFCFYPDER